MNDPNGPVYYQGEYHLFFQYNPFGDEWGHMSWGHAASPDMVHWRELPVAFPEEDGVMIFSGSAVVDRNNSSGFCRRSVGNDESCLVAIYTGATDNAQTQNLAYSNDRGRTWTKYAGNPVIDLHLRDFRDPKVFWFEPTRKWIMVVSLAPQHKIRFFSSSDLKHWTMLSDFGPAGATGGVWECPDLFELPVEGERGQKRWVLSVNLNPGGVAGGSGNQYFVGRFDGSKFVNENRDDQVLWADYGRDFYASTSFSNVPRSDGRRIWIAWLNNWDYASKLPTHPWRGAMTIPRALSLKRFPDGIRLVQRPIKEVLDLAMPTDTFRVKGVGISDANRILQTSNIGGDALLIEAEIDPKDATEIGIKVRKGASEETVIGVDVEKTSLFVDRTRSGRTEFADNFAGRHDGPMHLARGKTVKLSILVDSSSVEVFGNEGEAVISDLIFPSPESRGLELYSKGADARVVRLSVLPIASR
jgi:fructan beta-fructosidase